MQGCLGEEKGGVSHTDLDVEDIIEEVITIVPVDCKHLRIGERQSWGENISSEGSVAGVLNGNDGVEPLSSVKSGRADAGDAGPSEDVVQGEYCLSPCPGIAVLGEDDAVCIVVDIANGFCSRKFLADEPVTSVIQVEIGETIERGGRDGPTCSDSGGCSGRKDGQEIPEGIVCVIGVKGRRPGHPA